MTEPLVLLVAAMAVAVAVAAAWFSVPAPPELDGERWFKALLARALRASLPADEVSGLVPWHPAGRVVERKLDQADVATLPGPALPGEVALVEALAALPDPRARAAVLFEGHLDQLIATSTWSAAHDPARFLGPGFGWEEVDRGALTPIAEAAERRLSARWVHVRGDVGSAPDLAGALGAFCEEIPCPPLEEGVGEALAEVLLARVPEDDPASRLLAVASGAGVVGLLRALAAHPGLRDRVVAVLSVGGAIRGWPGREGLLSPEVCEDWLDHHFRHELLDVEVVREVPYLCLQWLTPGGEPSGAAGLPVVAARFPEPGFAGRESPMIRVVDLGVLWAHDPPPAEALAAALRVVTALWAWTRR